jgi:type IV pilus assembly protein PilB
VTTVPETPAETLPEQQSPGDAGMLTAQVSHQAGMLRAGVARHGLIGTRGGGQRRRIGEVLVEQGIIDEAQLAECLAAQSQHPATSRPRLGRLVVERGLANEKQVSQALAGALGLPLVDLSRTTIQPDVARLLPRSVSDRHGVLVVGREGNALTVAMSDPTNIVALDDVRLYTKAVELSVVVATDSEMRTTLGEIWSRTEDAEDAVADMSGKSPAEELTEEALANADVSDAPVVRLVDVLLADAVQKRASDIHVEPAQNEVRVRYRIDGLLRDMMTVPRTAMAALISRIKIISGLDIAERRRPQDGRTRLVIDGQQIDCRVSTLPSLYGEKVVIRLLARASELKSLKDIGMEEEHLEELLVALQQPQGLVLITGPTGSGKTSTLYAGIYQIRTPERNIVTLEDPVEIAVPGVVQVQINTKAGLTFAAGLRSVLRQDPDVVLVGEIRDTETAKLALEASMTGHLVLSTLHTNDAIGAVTRLIDIGVEPFLVGSSLTLVIAQRLVRRPCEECSAPYTPSPRQMQLLGLTERDLDGATPRRGKGCPRCGGTGYVGRLGVYEVLPITATLRQVLLTDPSERAIAAGARKQGHRLLRHNAIAKALRGETTFEEVLRVTQMDSHEGTHRCPSCSYRVAEDMVACPRCSTDLDKGNCRTCAKPLEPDWRICPYCRTDAGLTGFGAALADLPEPGRMPKILVVDEDVSVGGYLATTVADRLVVEVAATGDEALRKVSLETYDAIVLDLALPDLPGLEMVRLLREDPRTATVPLLLFTGLDDPKIEMEARTAGADDWLSKPAEPEDLLKRLFTLIGLESDPLP